MEVVNARAQRLKLLMNVALEWKDKGMLEIEIARGLDEKCTELWQLSAMARKDYVSTIMAGLAAR